MNNQDCFVYIGACFFMKGRRVIITNAFSKRTEKMPNTEKKICLRIKMLFEQDNGGRI